MKVLNKKVHGSPPNSVYVGRPTCYGNPFSHLPYGQAEVKGLASAADAVEAYRRWIEGDDYHSLLPQRRKEVIQRIKAGDLDGKDLVCWCAPGPCHASVLIELVKKYRS